MNPLTKAEEFANLVRDFENDGMSPVEARAAANHQVELEEFAALVHFVAVTNAPNGIDRIRQGFRTFAANTSPNKEFVR